MYNRRQPRKIKRDTRFCQRPGENPKTGKTIEIFSPIRLSLNVTIVESYNVMIQ